jgi:hypothetical protein
MFDYKNAEFFSEYFEKSSDFKVISSFVLSKEPEETNLFVGVVEVLNTIHPLVLRVEIPITFPHNKLTFRTKSLSGYPHLIHTGKINQGDWFCLNTPFAETAQEQLDQEVKRLKEWIQHQMREDLPAKIEDPNVIYALRVANAYEWENPDEVKEYSPRAILTLIGDGFTELSRFPNQKGHFTCVKTPDNRIYAFLHDRLGHTSKLPYIIVHTPPTDTSVLDDFLKLRDYYEWDDDICAHLLPNSYYHSGKLEYAFTCTNPNVDLTLEQSLALINEIRQELDKPESYIEQVYPDPNSKKKIEEREKPLIYEELNKVRKEVIKKDGVKKPRPRTITEDLLGDGEDDELIVEWVEHGQYVWDYFIIGFEANNNIDWTIFYTCPARYHHRQICYDIKVKHLYINTFTSLYLECKKAQRIDEQMFFGRGAVCQQLADKRIAIVGLGAIGSMVAENLAHSGIKAIGLWDSDIVEPGNICRSSYALGDLGNSKVDAICAHITSINPFIDLHKIKKHGYWSPNHTFGYNGWGSYVNGSFYDNVNYKNQIDAIKELDEYDIIIDCTGSNELLHFLSYAIPSEKKIISLCITNHANDLVCTTNLYGNPFELRKAYLSRIVQDTKNYYVEGSGCYSPTFLAKHYDIATLVNYFLHDFDLYSAKNCYVPSCIYSYRETGILKDQIRSYKLKDYDINLHVPANVLLDAEELYFETDGLNIGYVLGCYSASGKDIMITHIIPFQNAHSQLEAIFTNSNGIIDYIGDFAYSAAETNSFKKESLESLMSKSYDCDINTNNPLLALKTLDGSITFMLLINSQLVPFASID